MGRKRRYGRNISGILLLDKGMDITSNAALQQVKTLFRAKKAGHTGSLDPLATGLLPLCLGEATKLSSFLLDSDKEYEGTCQLGSRTRTGDAEGEVIDTRPVPEISEAFLKPHCDAFVGEIEQIPPMHSAIKKDGQPLYKLAHQGIEVEREPRKVTVYELTILSVGETDFRFRLRCSKGTYVRTLVEDIGERIGCGAYLASLRRTGVGPFHIDDAITYEELAHIAEDEGQEGLDKLLIPMSEALDNWPAVHLTENSAYYVRQGQPVQVPEMSIFWASGRSWMTAGWPQNG